MPEPIARGERVQPPDGWSEGSHRHPEGQLSWVAQGVQRVATPAGLWIAPAELAVWVAGGVTHDTTRWGPGPLHRVHLHRLLAPRLPRHCHAVPMTVPLRRALQHVTRARVVADERESDRRVVDCLLRGIVDGGLRPLQLPLGAKGILAPLANLLLQHPEDDRPLRSWAQLLRVSVRTLERRFQGDLGMSFVCFRRRARVHQALLRLAEGHPVDRVARHVGYDSPSAFRLAFHKELGAPPGRYFAPRPRRGAGS